MNRNYIVSTSIVFLFLIFFAINGLSDKLLSRFYFDLTEEGLYTLSQSSKKLVGKVSDPLTLKFYYSKSEGDNLPLVKLYGARVADLLREYSRISDGKIKVEIIDPKPDSEEEEWAEKFGLNAMNLPTGQKLFLGLVAINGQGEEAVIPIFDVRRQEYLEYDITKLIYSLDTQKQAKVGILSPLDILGEAPEEPQLMPSQKKPTKPWILANQLKKLFEIQRLPLEVEIIPEDISLLFIVHPRGFSDKLLYAIDQFVMRGGNLIIAEDPFAMVDAPAADPSNPMASFTYNRSSNINTLTEKWGFKLKDQMVVTDRYLATAVNTGQGGQTNFIAFLSILGNGSRPQETALIGKDVVTNELDNVMFAWAGALEITNHEDKNFQLETLLRTTEDAMLMEERIVRFSAENPNALAEKHVPGGKQLALAVKTTGKFESNYEAKVEGSPIKEHLAESVKPTTIIAFSDVDFLGDDYSAMSQNLFGTELISLINDNQTLAINAVDNLAGGSDLIALRSRGKFTRPFDKVLEIEASAQDKYKDVEQQFQASLDRANERLSKLQSGLQNDGKSAVMNEALLAEIQKIREEKRTAQRKLREVRLMLREDKEHLGTVLFLVNTFLIPLVLIFVYIWKVNFKKSRNA